MLFFIASIANVEVEVPYEVSSSRVDASKTLLELFIASAVKTREEVIVLQAVFLFARGDAIAVIMLSTTLIGLFVASQVVVAISGVPRSAPVMTFESLP